MREHVKILGILNIIMGSLTALVGVIALVVMGGVAGITKIALHAGEYDSDIPAAPILALIGVCIAAFFLLISAPSIIGGWGLLTFKPWSRIVMIIVSFFHLFHIPLGTALGVYGLWVLLNAQTQRLLESGGTLPVASEPGSYTAPYSGPPAPRV